MDGVAYAKSNTVLAHGGERISIRAGEPWDAGDPLVAAYPDMFAPTLEAVRSTTDPSGLRRVAAGPPQVEAATRAPGERRAVRARPRTSQ
ncbi:hypothetical protein [Candidatus Frankia alpina]|uniref:Uncharacterized protein n=1 Tax=Candidatus Frankia alpina TaxID=2699483 RepID=A0A4S5EU34_9ACTN|nr:hypothetical protein [Candidatus Frankia alpina]THJ75813.1 hypothetical protein E7Y31_03290 [Candidatus Frankia alpina]